jgi:hypothetical protein
VSEYEFVPVGLESSKSVLLYAVAKERQRAERAEAALAESGRVRDENMRLAMSRGATLARVRELRDRFSAQERLWSTSPRADQPYNQGRADAYRHVTGLLDRALEGDEA